MLVQWPALLANGIAPPATSPAMRTSVGRWQAWLLEALPALREAAARPGQKFVLSALVGLYVMHALSRISEGREVAERQVVQEFLLEARRSLVGLSSIAGGLVSLLLGLLTAASTSVLTVALLGWVWTWLLDPIEGLVGPLIERLGA